MTANLCAIILIVSTLIFNNITAAETVVQSSDQDVLDKSTHTLSFQHRVKSDASSKGEKYHEPVPTYSTKRDLLNENAKPTRSFRALAANLDAAPSTTVSISERSHQAQSGFQSPVNTPSVSLQSSFLSRNIESLRSDETIYDNIMLSSLRTKSVKSMSAITNAPTAAPSVNFELYLWRWLYFFFGWINWVQCWDPNSRLGLSKFAVEYEVDIGSFDPLLDTDSLKTAHDSSMAGLLNSETALSSTSFYSFDSSDTTIDSRYIKKNRRKANASGVCNTKKCDVPSSYAFPNKRLIDAMMMSPEETAILEELTNTPFAGPELEYQLARDRDETSVTYGADFQPNIETPWSGFTVSMEQVEGSLVLTEMESYCMTSQSECDTQMAAIISIFNRLELDHDETEHECVWKGVTCNELNLIVQLQIENLSISIDSATAFPHEIVDLVHLTKVYLNNNGFVGSIPDISSLTEIIVFSVANNALTGTIPPEFGLLQKMENLVLSNNDLQGGIPSQLCDLEGLVLLDIAQNTNLGQSIPAEFGNLVNLKTLKLSGCSLTSSVPNSFESITEAEDIILSNNNFSGKIDVFSKLTKLRVLQLDNNSFTGSISVSFQDLGELRSFSVYGNRLDGPFPNFIESFPYLTSLVLGGNAITGSIATEIGTLKNLKNLDVADCAITGGIPSEIGNLENLVVFNVVGNSMDASIPKEVGQLESLEIMVLAGNSFTGSIPTEVGLLSNLEAIDFGNNAITGTIPTELSGLTNLDDIFLAGNTVSGNIGFLCSLEFVTFDAASFPDIDCSISQNTHVGLLYEGLGVQNYGASDTAECEWVGITCNSIGAIIEINLAGLSLSGTISNAIGQIHLLEAFDFSHNQIQGILPAQVGSLLFLDTIILHDNDLTGSASFLCDGYNLVTIDVGEVDVPCVQLLGSLEISLADSSDAWASGYPDDPKDLVDALAAYHVDNSNPNIIISWDFGADAILTSLLLKAWSDSRIPVILVGYHENNGGSTVPSAISTGWKWTSAEAIETGVNVERSVTFTNVSARYVMVKLRGGNSATQDRWGLQYVWLNDYAG